MATETTTRLVDDIDGSKAVESLSFAVNGTMYEIDLSQANLKKFNTAVAPFVEHAREVRTPRASKIPKPRRGPTGGTGGKLKEQGLDAKEIRAWAREQGIEAGTLGRVPTAVIEQYRAAHGL